MLKKFIIITIFIILILLLSIFFIKENLKYEVNRDKTFKSPNGKHQITLRYDYASRPYVFKNGKLIYKYDGPGFNETVDWYIKWLSENEILLYCHSSNERYNEEYHIIIDWINYNLWKR